MSQSIERLLDSVRRALREDIAPQVTTDHARSQMAGVLDILSKLDRMVAWAPDALRERLGCIEDGCAAIEATAFAAGVVVPGSSVVAPMPPKTQAELEKAVETGDARLAALSDWLFDANVVLSPDLRRDLDSQLRATLRKTLMAERKLIARADFASMTSSGG